MSECTHDCESCTANCSSKKPSEKNDFIEKPHELTKIKKIFAIVSGKGGVGKSLVTCLLATAAQRQGKQVSVMDADITGPSVPQAFGLHEKADGVENFILPAKTHFGVNVMSINLLLENETDPVVWRGPVLAGVIKQFWTDVIWGDNDIMFIDMPPGTGDVPLTVFQSIPLSGIIVVTSPQELVSMIVEKAVNMAEMMKVPIVGLVENMSYFLCDNCGKKHFIYGESRLEEIAKKYGIKNTVRLPIDGKIPRMVDDGMIEFADTALLDDFVSKL